MMFGKWKARYEEVVKQRDALGAQVGGLRDEVQRLKVGKGQTQFDDLARRHALLLHQYQTMEHSKNTNAAGLEQQLNLAISCMTYPVHEKYLEELNLRGMGGQPGPSIFDRKPGLSDVVLSPPKEES